MRRQATALGRLPAWLGIFIGLCSVAASAGCSDGRAVSSGAGGGEGGTGGATTSTSTGTGGVGGEGGSVGQGGAGGMGGQGGAGGMGGQGGAGGGASMSNCTTSDTWKPIALTGAPSGRYWHEAVWTGTEMMVWGGIGADFLDTGGLYNPTTDTWQPVPTIGAPSPRLDHVMVWTGSEVLVWGGRDKMNNALVNGARFNPATMTWSPMTTTGAPPPTQEPEGVWTGTELLVWGDDTTAGARYNPATDTWTPMSEASAPIPRDGYVIRWSGSEVIVWGGRACGGGMCPYVNSGGRYKPTVNTWTATSTVGAPEGTYSASGVWTGAELILFGGRTCGFVTGCEVQGGGRYNPATDIWSPLNLNGAPTARHNHSGVWTGDRMLIWGGGGAMFNTGALFDPAAGTWTPMTTVGAPPGRRLHTGLWTSYGFITWGGITTASGAANDGAVYCPP